MSPLARVLAVLVLGFSVAHGAYQLGRAYLHHKQGLDFAPEYVAARMLVDQGDRRFYDHAVLAERGRALDIHGPLGPSDPIVNYAYPPWVAVLYVPLSRLPYDAARTVWFVLSVLATAGAAWLLGRAVAPTPEERRAFEVGTLAACCWFFPIFFGLMCGQANDVELLAIAASLYFLRTNRPFLAGLVLAPAGLWKIFTGFPVLFLLARREWRAIGGLALGCAAIVVASLPFVGVETWLDWFHYIQRHNELGSAALRNHSILNAVLFFFKPNGLAEPLADAPGLVRPLTLALQGGAVAATIVALATPRRRDEPGYAVQFAATLVLAVLLAPRSWEHYGLFLLPAFAACAAAAAAPAGVRRMPETASLFLLGGIFCVWGLVFQIRDEYRALTAGARVHLRPATTYATLLPLGLCVWLARRRPVADEPLEIGRGVDEGNHRQHEHQAQGAR